MGVKMRRKNQTYMKTIIAGVGCTLLGLCLGCGNYSREDFLFHAALPAAEEVALIPPGVSLKSLMESSTTVQNALSHCEERSLRCKSKDLAEQFNEITVKLMGHVNEITSRQPTRRRAGKRVWGPYRLESGATIRFEMERRDAESFHYCLHMSEKKVPPLRPSLRDINCNTLEDDNTGYVRVLSGQLQKGSVSYAETGSGNLFIDSPRLGAFTQAKLPKVTFDLSFERFEGTKYVHVDFAHAIDPSTGRDAGGTYAYQLETDGSGAFSFEKWDNFIGSENSSNTLDEERLLVWVQWKSDYSGKAEAKVSQGNVEGEAVQVTECWDADLSTTYFRGENVNQEPTGSSELEDCPLFDVSDESSGDEEV